MNEGAQRTLRTTTNTKYYESRVHCVTLVDSWPSWRYNDIVIWNDFSLPHTLAPKLQRRSKGHNSRKMQIVLLLWNNIPMYKSFLPTFCLYEALRYQTSDNSSSTWGFNGRG